MRLVSYRKGGKVRGGVERAGRIYDLEAAMKRARVGQPVSDLRAVLDQPGWKQTLKKLKFDTRSPSTPRSTAKLAAPIGEPQKLVISGLNSHSHLKELEDLTGKVEPPRYPMVIGKAAINHIRPLR